MIYLIGGPARCGKTTVARKLAKKLNTSWVSTDTLESIASIYVQGPEQEKLFPKSTMRKLTSDSNDEMYGKYSAEEIVGAFRKQAKTVQKAIVSLVETTLDNSDTYIIEGHHLSPGLMNEFRVQHGEKVKAVVLLRKDKDTIIQSGRKFPNSNDWFTQKTKSKETFSKIAAMIQLYSKVFEREATRYSIPVFNMDDGFKKGVQQSIATLINEN